MPMFPPIPAHCPCLLHTPEKRHIPFPWGVEAQADKEDGETRVVRFVHTHVCDAPAKRRVEALPEFFGGEGVRETAEEDGVLVAAGRDVADAGMCEGPVGVLEEEEVCCFPGVAEEELRARESVARAVSLRAGQIMITSWAVGEFGLGGDAEEDFVCGVEAGAPCRVVFDGGWAEFYDSYCEGHMCEPDVQEASKCIAHGIVWGDVGLVQEGDGDWEGEEEDAEFAVFRGVCEDV